MISKSSTQPILIQLVQSQQQSYLQYKSINLFIAGHMDHTSIQMTKEIYISPSSSLLYRFFLINFIKRDKSMSNQSFQNEFSYLIASFNQFIRIFYRIYKPYLKLIALFLLAYLSFLFGRSSIIDRLQQSVNGLQRLLQNRVKYTIELPDKLNRIKKARKILLWLAIGISLLLAAKYYKIKVLKAISFKILIVFNMLALGLFLLALMVQKLVQYWISRGRTIDIGKNQQLYGLQKEFGPKVQGLLKIFLCKPLFINYKEPSAYICHKQNCKQYRVLLRERQELIQNLVFSAFNFNWCSICRKRLPFEQYLSFNSNPFYEQTDLSQIQQVSLRNNYLYEQMERMIVWTKELTPCNCSRIYWQQEIAKIKIYKTKQKALEQSLIISQYRK